MLVKDCMTRHPIMISARTPAAEAQQIMAENHIRHLPVVGNGKRLLGLITRQRLAMKPDEIGSLNVWEITRRLSDLTAEKIMLKAAHVRTTSPEITVEQVSRVMTTQKIGCLPVIEDDAVVLALNAYERVNYTSLHIGEYESLKKDAVDLYTFMRDAYEQNRDTRIKE